MRMGKGGTGAVSAPDGAQLLGTCLRRQWEAQLSTTQHSGAQSSGVQT